MHSLQERNYIYGQEILELAEQTNGIGEKEKELMAKLENLSRDGFEKLMKENELDATVTLGPGWPLCWPLEVTQQLLFQLGMMRKICPLVYALEH